jgi:hypothetical protein
MLTVFAFQNQTASRELAQEISARNDLLVGLFCQEKILEKANTKKLG